MTMGVPSTSEHAEEDQKRHSDGQDEKIPTDKGETTDSDEKNRKAEGGGSEMMQGKEGHEEGQDAQAVADLDGDEDTREYPSGIKLFCILLGTCLATLLVALDQTIIAPALGTLTTHFHSVEDIGWYGAAYLLTTTALQPMYGTLYKLFNAKHVYLAAIILFEIGSLVCAAAPTSTAFIVGRAVAGLGTAGLFSGAFVLLSLCMPLPKRPLAFGLLSGMYGIASVAGPLLGGVFTEKVTWRWCFYINLPIGAVTIAIVVLFVQFKRDTSASAPSLSVVQRIRQLDIIGTAIFIPAIVMLLIALEWGGNKFAWKSAKIIGLLVGAVLGIMLFIGAQVWRGDAGTLPPRLFSNRSLIFANIYSFFFGAAFLPMTYYMSLYFQAIQGVSAVQAGIKIIPFLLSTVVSSIITGAIISVIGYYNWVIVPSMLVYTVGAGMLTTWEVHTPLRVWFGYEVLVGLGIGAGFQSGLLVVQTVLPPQWIPLGTAGIQFFQALGGAIFMAVSQTVFQNGLMEKIRRDDLGIDPLVFVQSGASQVKQVLEQMGRTDALEAVLEAYMVGLRNTYYVTLAMAGCAFLACLGYEYRSVKKNPKGKAVPAHV